VIIPNLKTAFLSMASHRLRTSLSILGIIIGVASVILVGSVGMSGKNAIMKELEMFGLRSLYVFSSYKEDNPIKRKERKGDPITNGDILAIPANCPKVTSVAPICWDWGSWVRHRTRFAQVRLIATTPAISRIRNELPEIGRFLTEEDLKNNRRVCVVGRDIAKKLFPKEKDPIGKEILHIGRRLPKKTRYTIVGVLKVEDTPLSSKISGMPMEENKMFVPITIFQRALNTKGVDDIVAEAILQDQGEEAAEEIKGFLEKRYKGKFCYESETMQQHIDVTNQILGTVAWIGVIAAVVSLLVGGIGIMNVMVSSVAERTREIGIRKSLGARDKDILFQFLTEASVLSIIGGAIGILIGISATLAIETISKHPSLLSREFVALAIFVSCLVGILSGLYPAIRASRLDPIDALRYE
jgi:ABC-type antimicrobial peptide transport system permease subunit